MDPEDAGCGLETSGGVKACLDAGGVGGFWGALAELAPADCPPAEVVDESAVGGAYRESEPVAACGLDFPNGENPFGLDAAAGPPNWMLAGIGAPDLGGALTPAVDLTPSGGGGGALFAAGVNAPPFALTPLAFPTTL